MHWCSLEPRPRADHPMGARLPPFPWTADAQIQVGCRSSPAFLSPLCAEHTRWAAIVTSCLPARLRGKAEAAPAQKKQKAVR